MTANPFDQACRYFLRQEPHALLAWLLGLPRERLEFVDWLDTRQVPWPGQPDRTCDTVAHLRDPLLGGLPWAVAVEFQVDPDEQMFGRMLSYLGDVWRGFKPAPHRGDRFAVGGVVVNLRGRGQASRRMRWRGTPLDTRLGVAERNLAGAQAARTLAQIEAGQAPRSLLVWIPLMQGGSRSGIIQRWLDVAKREADAGRRRALGLAEVFADAAGCAGPWQEVLKGWDVMESKIVNEWTAEALRRGENRGRLEGKVDTLLRVLRRRFPSLPQAVETTIRTCKDLAQLDAWADAAVDAASLADFRRDAGL